MSAVEVVGGTLNQYDKDRRVLVDDPHPGDFVDFGRSGLAAALRMGVDGDGWALVPNQLLTQSGVLYFWLTRAGQTVASGRESISPRAQPPDYVYEDTPTIGYAQLAQRVDELEERFGELELKFESVSALEYATDEDIAGLYERKEP